MADVYLAMGLYALAIGCIESGLKYTYQHYDWVERKDNWISKSDELLLYAYKGLKDYPNAIQHGNIAVHHDPNNIRLLQTYINCLEEQYNAFAEKDANQS